MTTRPPISTRTDALVPYATLFRAAAGPRESCPERLTSARPLTMVMFRVVNMARCRMKGLDAQGSNASRNRNTRLGTSQRPRAGAVDIECAALISGLSLSEQPFRTNHQHHDHDQEDQHIGRAGTEKQTAVDRKSTRLNSSP